VRGLFVLDLRNFSSARLLVPILSSLLGCVGMRTPLDDASAEVTCKSATTTKTTRLEADVLIVLDRSASMNWSLAADDYCSPAARSCSSRLDAVVPAVGQVVSNNPSIRWGLELFATPNASGYCAVSSTPQVKVGTNAAAAIESELAGFTTSLSTPTRAAIDVATSYLKTVGDGNSKAILLATDGLPTCAVDRSWETEDMPGTIAAVAAAKKAGFPVYVIGMGPSKSISNLNQLAEAGGTGKYYPVTSTDALEAALASVARMATATCSFKAAKAPSTPDLVYVYVDKHLVDKDENDGWSFDENDPTYATIVLTGSYCKAVQAGDTQGVQVVVGCPDAPPPAVLP
jgi:hypothetical protein